MDPATSVSVHPHLAQTRVTRRSLSTKRAVLAAQTASARLLDLPEDVLLAACSLWPAACLANFVATCRDAYLLLEPAIVAALQRMGFAALPDAHDVLDSRTRRLHFLQRLASHQPQTLSAGGTTSLCVSSSGAVLAWGGAEHEDGFGGICIPVFVPLPSFVSVREVAAGDVHCLLLAADGVYSWGADNSFGQLGHGDTEPQRVPRRIEALRPSGAQPAPAQVACGRQHSLVLCVDGGVHSFGRGCVGQLGLGGTADELLPRRIMRAAPEGDEMGHGAMPRVTLLSAGVFHSLAVTEGGALYSWGSGTNGRLGHGDTVMRLRPRRVEALGDVDVVHASAGSGHSLAVSAGGALYTWGQGYNGRLGHGNQETKPQPAIVEALLSHTIRQAVAGSEFTIAVTDKGARTHARP